MTNKDDAKDRIGKAIGGLLLALSAVVILQTINPNLIELDPLGEVNVDGEELVSPDFDDISGFTFNPDDTGLYYCFSHDSWGANDYGCAETMSKCQDVKAADSNSYSECRAVVYYQGEYDDSDIDEAEACYGYFNQSFGNRGVNCYSSANDCDSAEQDAENTSNETVEVSCKSPNSFNSGEGGGSTLYTSEGEVAYLNVDTPYEGVIGTSTESGIIAMEKCQADGEEWIDNNTGPDKTCNIRQNGENDCSVEGCDQVTSSSTETVVSGPTMFACSRNEDGLNDACTQEQVRDCQSCNTLDSFGLTNHFRSPPSLCHPDYATAGGDQCEINSGLADKLQNFKSNLNAQDTDVFWRMTEAWPPTLRHASQCHAVGTCVDIALRKNSAGERWVNDPESATPKHVNQINSFIESAENAGLSVTYEVGSEELLNLLTSGSPSVSADKIINIGVAPHFSVYRSVSDR